MEVSTVKTKIVVPPRETRLRTKSPLVAAFLAGSFSGTCSTVLFQPLDLIKTRIQTQPQGLPRQSVAAVLSSTIRNEGVLGLWRGLIPSLMRTVPGVGIYFSTVHTLRSKLSKVDATSSLAIGFTARSVACSAMIPMTVIKLRSEVNPRGRPPLASSLPGIWRTEGMRGLTRGLLPTILRDAPYSGLYMMMYEQIKSAEWNTYDSALANGLVAGGLASLITHPADVIKTKMQVTTGHKTVLTTCSRILSTYGVRGFLLGLGPRLLRRSMMAGLAWSVYERAIKSLGIK